MIHILNRRADAHQNFCEDAYYHTERDGWVIAAVFDGCSRGINSHFASQLMSYLLRDTLREKWNQWFQYMNRMEFGATDMLSAMCLGMWNRLKTAEKNLSLEELEILSTVVLALYNPRSKYLAVQFVGDGLLLVNGEAVTRVTSGADNMPKYLAYTVQEEANMTEFPKIHPYYVFTNVTEWSICTDGIDQIQYEPQGLNALDYLLKDKSLWASAKMLDRKVNLLQKNGAALQDDVTIIRYTNETV